MPSLYDNVKITRNQDRRAKATEKQVEEMRKLYAKGTTQKAIAEKFGMSQSAVCYIVSEKAHEHLADYRKANPPKRRTREEMAVYMRNLRAYKRDLHRKSPLYGMKVFKIKKNKKEGDAE